MAELDVTLGDTLAALDQLMIETAFNTDILDVSDSILIALSYRTTVSDTAAVTDSVAVGFVRWVNASDTVEATDQFSRDINYGRDLTDTVVTADAAYKWSIPDDEQLEVDFEGSADLKAVLIKRKAASAVVTAAPPRTVRLPRPPKELLEHNVVDPNPPSRRDR